MAEQSAVMHERDMKRLNVVRLSPNPVLLNPTPNSKVRFTYYSRKKAVVILRSLTTIVRSSISERPTLPVLFNSPKALKW